MACTEPVRQCLYEHFRPHLAGVAVEENGERIRARCPVCGATRALTVSVGQIARIKYNCFNDCPKTALRLAFTNADIRSSCIPVLKDDDIKMLHQAAVAAFQQGATGSRAQAHLRAYLICIGYSRWPKGTELLKLAAECGVSKAEAYNARKSGSLLSSTLVPLYLPE